MPRALFIRPAWPLAIALAVSVLVAFWGSYTYALVFDDAMIPGLSLEALSFGPRWLSRAGFAATTAWLGLDVSVLRVQNVLLHAAVVLALFAFLRALLLEARAAAIGAAVFAVHPVTVYGVAYLAQRSIVMATLFSVLGLHAWLQGLRGAGRGWLAASAAFFALAVLSKEHAIMLPAVAAALALAVREQIRAPMRWVLAALLAQGAVALWVLYALRSLVGGAIEPHLAELGAAAAAAGEQLWARSAITQGLLFFGYVLVWLVPLPALMSVDLRWGAAPSLGSPVELAGAIAYLAFGAAALGLTFGRGRRSLAGFALLVPWLLYFTEFATVRVQEPFVLYRSYIWGIGVAIGVAVALERWPRPALAWAAVAVCVALAGVMRERLETFSSPLALWDDAVRKIDDVRLPFADRAIGNRGTALLEVGRYAEARRDLDLAIALNPRNARALATRGSLNVAEGQLRRAEADFGAAVRSQPALAEAWAARCGVRIVLRDLAGALADCDEAIARDARLPLGRLNRGVLFAQGGQLERALAEFEAVLAAEPANAIARQNSAVLRGRLAARAGRLAQSDGKKGATGTTRERRAGPFPGDAPPSRTRPPATIAAGRAYTTDRRRARCRKSGAGVAQGNSASESMSNCRSSVPDAGR